MRVCLIKATSTGLRLRWDIRFVQVSQLDFIFAMLSALASLDLDFTN